MVNEFEKLILKSNATISLQQQNWTKSKFLASFYLIFVFIEYFPKSASSLKPYKTASCAEIAGNYFYSWINVTCEQVAKNGTNITKLVQEKSNWQKSLWWRKKKNRSAIPE